MIISSLQEFISLLKINHPLIGIDYGSKKLGFAISSPDLQISLPLKVILAEEEEKKINFTIELIHTYKIAGIIIGLPISMNGSENDSSLKVRSFAQLMSTKIDLPIFLQDERLSTKGANNLLKSFGMNRKDRNKQDDKIAASLILETTLNSISKL